MSQRRRRGSEASVLAMLMILTTSFVLANADPATSTTDGGSGAPDSGVSDRWLDAARREMTAIEYYLTWQTETHLPGLDAAWQAPNRAHNFRTYFTETGIRLVPRDWDGAGSGSISPPWELSLRLAEWGRPAATRPVESARLSAGGDRMSYDRGAIVEWYLNQPKGLEQGFTIAERPDGTVARDGKASVVVLDLALGGTLTPFISEDGQAIDFATGSGVKVVHYAQLSVIDALGQALPARLEGFSRPGLRGIRIAFEDQDAVYPVTVDPLATSPAWTAEGERANVDFGVSVATAGDVNGDRYADVIVGAMFYDNGQSDEGRAFAYLGSASGLATSPAWTGESDQAIAYFGNSVATAGDVNGDGYADVIVGAYTYDNGEIDEGGRTYVYLGSATGLAPSPAWTAQGDQASAFFGYSVATAGDVNGDGYSDVIAGAVGYDNGHTNEGRAFVYLGSATGLGLATNPAWTAESDRAGGRFGNSVATAGDVNGDSYADVIVGASAYSNVQSGEGRAFVYLGSASGLATGPAWTAESDQANASFGTSVATAGDVNGDGYADVIVGAPFYDNRQENEGRAFVYPGSASGLATSPAWTVESDQAIAEFGTSVATAGDVNGDGYADVMVGAPFCANGEIDEGRAFVYLGSASGLATSPAWTAESDQAGAFFSYSVATAGDVNGDGYSDVIAGAMRYDNGQTDEGRAFVYLGSATGLATSSGWTADGDQVDDLFGFSVAAAGDINGDGYADVIVGAASYDNGQTDEGRAFVYLGSALGLATSPAWTAESNQTAAFFGTSVATAGDVNGDGYADVIIGADGYDNGETNEGRAYVYLGSVTGLATSPAWTAEGDQATVFFGLSAATAGDVNGDGYSDVITAAFAYDNGETNEGRAYVYLGSVLGLATGPSWTAESDQTSAFFGRRVATAGDVNGDGYTDVIVGAYTYDNGETNEGRAFVYLGSASGLATSPAWTAESDRANASFGTSVATAGDVNGDGYADVIVGADFYDNSQTNEGRAFVYFGSASGLATSPTWTAESDHVSAHFGNSVAAAGDVNGDGYSDVIVGAYNYDNGETNEGRAFVYLGSVSGLATSSAWTAESDQEEALFGYSVAAAGDVNGDGYADVIVGAPSDGLSGQGGRAFIYYGNGGPGLSLRPQQRRTTDSEPISHLGLSDSPDSFRLALLGRSPFGRGRLQLEWEVKPLGASLNGIATETAIGWADSGIGGAALSEPVVNLTEQTLYHWRVRMRYDPVTTPFGQRSRWLTIPWGGWQEAMLRTAGAAPAGRSRTLVIAKTGGEQLELSWGASCLAADTDYAIYEGTLGDFTSHTSSYCSTGGATTQTFTPVAGDTYYLIVPLNATHEGSYGLVTAGERPVGADPCLPQQIGTCE